MRFYQYLASALLAFLWASAAAPQARSGPVQEQLPLSRLPLPDEEIVVTRTAGGETRTSLRKKAAAGPAPPLPVGSDLLALAKAKSFGSDGRCAAVRSDGRLHLTCRPGVSTSGVVLGFSGHRLPIGGKLQLLARFSGGGGFHGELTRKGADALAPMPLSSGAWRGELPNLGAAEPQLVILAPADGGRLSIDLLEIGAAAHVTAVGGTAAWAWEPVVWQLNGTATLAQAAKRGIGRLFITLEMQNGRVRDASALRRFVAKARAANIKVEAVEGDPAMVLAEGRGHAVARAAAFAEFQRTSPPAERLAGIQYDIEPYTLGAWGRAPVDHGAWADTILALSQTAGEPVDLVLPFWIGLTPEGQGFLARVAPAIRGVTVMSYRTAVPELTQIAEPLLAWGAQHGIGIRLALEAERLADEVEETFVPDDAGTLGVFPDRPSVAVKLEQEAQIAGARMYSSRGKVVVRAARISFMGDEARMRQVAEQTRPLFSAWPSFTGFAMHGLHWPS